MPRSWPARSSRRGCGLADSRTKRSAASRAAAPTGRVTKKTQRQPGPSPGAPPDGVRVALQPRHRGRVAVAQLLEASALGGEHAGQTLRRDAVAEEDLQ